MPAVLANAKKYIGREPKAVSDKIEAIVVGYTENASADQEKFNDDFYSLIEHVRFFNTKAK